MEKAKEVELPEKIYVLPSENSGQYERKLSSADHVCNFALPVKCSKNALLRRLAEHG